MYVNPVPVRQRHILDHEIDFIPHEGPAKCGESFVGNNTNILVIKKLDQATPILIRLYRHRD
jgi:hypothetical protein